MGSIDAGVHHLYVGRIKDTRYRTPVFVIFDNLLFLFWASNSLIQKKVTFFG